MPEPNENESRDEFVERCIPVVLGDGTAEDQEQAVAVCNSMWEQAGKTTDVGETLTDSTAPAANTFRVTQPDHNALKAVSVTEDELRVGNYIALYGGRDLEGHGSHRVNQDGSKGEFFAPDTVFDSDYTKAGAVFVDWEHQQDVNPITKEPITQTFGVVDWSTAKSDERGLWVERILDRRNRYVRWVESLIAEGLIGTSSEPVQGQVEKAEDGKITRWPLRRDTLTVQPMEHRMMKEFGPNHLQAFKALGIPVPDDTATLIGTGPDIVLSSAPTWADPPDSVTYVAAGYHTIATVPEPEAAPEADTSAADAARERLRLELELLKRRNNEYQRT